MRFEALSFKIGSTLLKSLNNARLKVINQENSDLLYFDFIKKKDKYRLLFNTSSNNAHFRITNSSPISSNLLPYVSNIKKIIEGAILIESKMVNNDRILSLTFSKIDRGLDYTRYYLYYEIIGPEVNIILCDRDNKILELKQSHPYPHKRILVKGLNYQIPDIINDEIYLSHEVREYLKESNRTIDDLLNSDTLYYNDTKYYHYKAFDNLKSDTFFNALDIFYRDKSESSGNNSIYIKLIDKAISKERQTIKKIESELSDDVDLDNLLSQANMLLMIEDKSKHLDSIKIDDDIIKLDIKYDILENAKKIFKKVKKIKQARVIAKTQINIHQDYISRLEDYYWQIESADSNSLIDIIEELKELKIIKGHSILNKKKAVVKAARYYTIIESNYTIYYGKNSKQNETVSFKIAKNDDYFFHIKDHHGSHVIVRTNTLTDDIILKAAKLAASYSDFKGDKAEVEYTKRANVTRIKDAQVAIKNYKTIIVDIKK